MSYQTRTSLRHPGVPFRVERAWQPACELLIGLFATGTPGDPRDPSWAPASAKACPPRTRAALRAVGERSGEIWLHILGFALDFELTPATIATADPLELRRYLVGEYVPAWRSLVGAEVLAAAAEGDAAAIRILLRQPRYYAGRARESLRTLLPLSADETRARLAEAVAAFHDDVFLDAEVDASLQAAATAPVPDGDEVVPGYRYVHEPGLDRVVLIPHLAAAPWLLLCQHRSARVVCHPIRAEATPADRLLLLGRALGDERRIAILERLRNGEATLQELADAVGIAKSTVHHHAAHLRAAQLIALRGNAARYAYVLDEAGFAEGAAVLERMGHISIRR